MGCDTNKWKAVAFWELAGSGCLSASFPSCSPRALGPASAGEEGCVKSEAFLLLCRTTWALQGGLENVLAWLVFPLGQVIPLSALLRTREGKAAARVSWLCRGSPGDGQGKPARVSLAWRWRTLPHVSGWASFWWRPPWPQPCTEAF